jgi:hypothetical protein
LNKNAVLKTVKIMLKKSGKKSGKRSGKKSVEKKSTWQHYPNFCMGFRFLPKNHFFQLQMESNLQNKVDYIVLNQRLCVYCKTKELFIR